jgi:hypothetical protein
MRPCLLVMLAVKLEREPFFPDSHWGGTGRKVLNLFRTTEQVVIAAPALRVPTEKRVERLSMLDSRSDREYQQRHLEAVFHLGELRSYM